MNLTSCRLEIVKNYLCIEYVQNVSYNYSLNCTAQSNGYLHSVISCQVLKLSRDDLMYVGKWMCIIYTDTFCTGDRSIVRSWYPWGCLHGN